MKEKIKKSKSIGIFIGIYAVVQALNYFGLVNSYIMQLFMLAGINIIMTISLNILNGFTGLFSIGHAGLMGIGAYVSAIFTTFVLPTASIPAPLTIVYFIVALIMGGIVSGAIGFLIGIPTLRLRGDYLAIVTLAFGEIVRAIIRMIPFVGGARGLTGIPNYSSFSIIYVFVILTIIVARNFVNSSYGRACISIRENEIAADSMGLNVYKYKMISFVFSAAIAGVAGGLFSHLYMFIQPDQFSLIKSCDLLVFLYAGGTASISGSILGAGLLTILPELLRFLSNWRIVIYAVLLVFIMLKRPNGLYGNKEFSIIKVKNF